MQTGSISRKGKEIVRVINKIREYYWGAYYLVYVGCVGIFSWLEIGKDDRLIYLLAAIFSVSAGIALLAIIVGEVIGIMILLIPARIKKLKEEGREEGRAIEREENRARLIEWAREQDIPIEKLPLPENKPTQK